MKRKILLIVAMILAMSFILASCAAQPGPQGEKGPQGEQGAQGEPGVNGTDGKTPEFRNYNGWVQWKYTTEEAAKWKNLYQYGTASSNPGGTGGLDFEGNYTVTTVSNTDDYGLAGTYTMLNAKGFEVGATVDLAVTVNAGYNFEGWYIDDTLLSKDAAYSYTMQSESVTINAVFSSYTVTTRSTSNVSGAAGTFTALTDKKVSAGETVALVATVNDGYNFEGWFVGDICVSRSLTYNHVMEKKNATFEARFSCYRITTVGAAYNADGYKAAGFSAGTYTQYSNTNLSAGKTVTLTATVNDGYNFIGWYIDDSCVSTALEYTLTMEKKDVTVEARYKYYQLTTDARHCWYSYVDSPSAHDKFDSPALHISPVYNDLKVSAGTSITVEATDIAGYTFVAWRTEDAVLCQDKTYTFTMPEGDLYLYALYSES